MSTSGQVIVTAVPFIWLGMVLAISFVETPLKFRAPGITIPLGLGIGRLVFRALNTVEVLLACLLVVAAALTGGLPGSAWALIVGVCFLLSAQVAVLRPALDRRVRELLDGAVPPQSRKHLAYIALEGVKVIALTALGIILTSSFVS